MTSAELRKMAGRRQNFVVGGGLWFRNRSLLLERGAVRRRFRTWQDVARISADTMPLKDLFIIGGRVRIQRATVVQSWPGARTGG